MMMAKLLVLVLLIAADSTTVRSQLQFQTGLCGRDSRNDTSCTDNEDPQYCYKEVDSLSTTSCDEQVCRLGRANLHLLSSHYTCAMVLRQIVHQTQNFLMSKLTINIILFYRYKL